MGHVGIDVGKTWLDTAALPAAPGLPRRVANTEAGVAALVAALGELGPTLVVLEATGADHRPLLTALLAAGVPTALANPAQVAAFRQTGLGREQTDTADARLPTLDCSRAAPPCLATNSGVPSRPRRSRRGCGSWSATATARCGPAPGVPTSATPPGLAATAGWPRGWPKPWPRSRRASPTWRRRSPACWRSYPKRTCG